jgi:hypothetical protein
MVLAMMVYFLNVGKLGSQVVIMICSTAGRHQAVLILVSENPYPRTPSHHGAPASLALKNASQPAGKCGVFGPGGYFHPGSQQYL